MQHIVTAEESLDFPKRPSELHTEDGYVYAVEFGNGIVKVGRTNDPSKRMVAHHVDGQRFGNGIKRWWVSEPHRGNSSIETSIHEYCRSTGTISGGREYFFNVTIEQVVLFANTLSMKPSTQEEIDFYTERRAAIDKQWKDAISRKLEANKPPEGWVRIDLPAELANVLYLLYKKPDELAEIVSGVPNDDFYETLEEMADLLGTEAVDIMGWNIRELMMEYVRTTQRLIELEVKANLLESGEIAYKNAWGYDSEPAL